jgi:hypothetical protein
VNSTIAAPVSWIEEGANLRFPAAANDRLQRLMGRNNEGRLAEAEKEELEALVELSEEISVVRCGALKILDRRPM